jgi:hypothetical protein
MLSSLAGSRRKLMRVVSGSDCQRFSNACHTRKRLEMLVERFVYDATPAKRGRRETKRSTNERVRERKC